MKKSLLIFFGFLLLGVIILAACVPGQAIRKKAPAPVTEACSNVGQSCATQACCGQLSCLTNQTCAHCAPAGQACGSGAGGRTCCGNMPCTNGLCNCRNDADCGPGKRCSNGQCLAVCAPSVACVGNILNVTNSSCISTLINCQYGCSGGQCNPPPSNVTNQTCNVARDCGPGFGAICICPNNCPHWECQQNQCKVGYACSITPTPCKTDVECPQIDVYCDCSLSKSCPLNKCVNNQCTFVNRCTATGKIATG